MSMVNLHDQGEGEGIEREGVISDIKLGPLSFFKSFFKNSLRAVFLRYT